MHQQQPGVQLGYQPALDGLRGASLLAVLLYHSEVGWPRGALFGVSTFFTLSGFLITTLLLAEQQRRGGIDLGQFYIRRFRRLLPAALLCLAGVVVFGATVATDTQLVDLRGDVLAALAYVANWHLILSGDTYAGVFASPSPIQHFWSLAIEEQFYLVFPLVVVGILAIGRGSWRFLGWVLGGLTAASVALSAVLSLAGASTDRVYFGTDTRAGELLIGAVLAVVVSLRGSVVFEGRRGQWVRSAGVVALAITTYLWFSTSIDATWVYYGGLSLYGVVTATIVLAAVQPDSFVRRALSLRPLVVLGLVSYGAYLFHWPIYLWLSPERTGLDGYALLALRLAVTGVAAALSYFLVEKPIRSGQTLKGGLTPWIAVPAAISLVAVAAVAVTVDAPTDEVVNITDSQAAAVEQDVDPVEVGNLGDPAGGGVRIGFYGDSSALTLAVGANQWIDSTTEASKAGGITQLGCGIGRGGERISEEERTARAPDDCWSSEWAANAEVARPDIAVVLSGMWDLTDRRLEDDDQWRSFGDPVYDAYLLEELDAATQVLLDAGAEVVWLTTPKVEFGQVDGIPPPDPHPASTEGRAERMNALIREVAARHPGEVHVLDLQAHLASLPAGEMDPEVRPDGVHFTTPSAEALTASWLGPALLELWRLDQAAEAVQGATPTTVPG
ncbi:hypothetical protein B7486_51615 [cyanobacterium TDX16]|nr:hypothetical protein B7486_51615 [cyanobacterium TDX16]